ncbi:MAG: hypothetical protein PWR31_1811 [Bacillota bacterium]|nr:hypothetical protein [Bacillota bacterium]
MGGRLKPGRWDRLARWVPLLVLLLAGLVAQVLLHGPAARLGLARRLLLPFVLLAAAALWPGLLHPPEPEKDTGSRKILALLLSLITVPLVLLAVPLWYGHGCWAPDLYSFLLYLAAGEVSWCLGAGASWEGGRRSSAGRLPWPFSRLFSWPASSPGWLLRRLENPSCLPGTYRPRPGTSPLGRPPGPPGRRSPGAGPITLRPIRP